MTKKKITLPKKTLLSLETIRVLDARQLGQVHGGGSFYMGCTNDPTVLCKRK